MGNIFSLANMDYKFNWQKICGSKKTHLSTISSTSYQDFLITPLLADSPKLDSNSTTLYFKD